MARIEDIKAALASAYHDIGRWNPGVPSDGDHAVIIVFHNKKKSEACHA